MNVYQRPLFRQMGGPVAPEMGQMMPQGMPPAPMAAPQMMPPQGLNPRAAEAVTQVEQGAAMQAEQYGQNMMAGLDSAETPEELINAMRGNQRPLEARYGELAGLVGEADAQRTPETVLALLQPVMMMTEQGAMDSGIGELMGQLTGNIDMMDEAGAPTQMGQGVGSLMMAGVGQQPVANFSQGGAVQRFQVGGEASRLQQLYSEMLPVYEGVMGGGEDQRNLTQAQILFDISDRFGAFAAGIDPRTGERMRGSSAAQFAAAASGLGGQIGERLGAQDQQDRALRVAALQGAAGEFSAERADQRAAARAAATAGITDADFFAKFGMSRDEFRALPVSDQRRLQGLAAEVGADVKGIPRDVFDSLSAENQQRVLLGDASPGAVNGIPRDIFDALPAADQQKILGTAPETAADIKGIPSNVFSTLSAEDQRRVLVGDTSPSSVSGIPRDIFDALSATDQQKILGTAPETAADIKGIPANVFSTLSAEDQRRVLVGDTSPGSVSGIPRDIFDALSATDQQKILGTAPEAPSGSLINIQMSDGSVRTVREDSPEADRLIDVLGGTVVSRTAAEQPSPLAQPDIMAQYAAGALSPAEEARVQEELAGRLKSVWNPETGSYEKPAVTPLIRQAEEARRTAGLPTVMTFGEEQEPVSNVTEGLDRLSQFAGTAFGTGPGVLNIVNKAFALVDANAPFPDQMEGINIVNTLNETATLAFRDMTAGRPAQDAVNQFATLSPAPGAFTGSPDSAASQIRALLDLWNRELRQSEAALNSGILSATDRATVQSGVNASADMISAYQALLRGIEGGGPGAARPNPADFRR